MQYLQHIISAELPADQSRSRHGINWEISHWFYINERWCTDVTVLKKMCTVLKEDVLFWSRSLFIKCKPFYSPREFCSFILVSVYIPPQAHVSSALQKLADLITDTEQKYPDSVLIILKDFNKVNLSRELPKYRQHVTCPTRDSKILDHCSTTIKDAFHSVPRAALGLSDHWFALPGLMAFTFLGAHFSEKRNTYQ